ncbi:AMP-binding protein [Candidatus Micrarchaeota archaeon]|nr:AMP-binding protein [Candidatus Micrarchaeota archaeon]
MRKHNIKTYDELVRKSTQDVEWFWGECERDLGVVWDAPYSKVADSSKGIEWTRWFVGGKLNVARNCLERHAQKTPDKLAYVWEADDGKTRKMTYGELDKLASRVANALTKEGLRKGDRVGIYMPMTLEIAAVFYGCLKAGLVIIPIFSGFAGGAVKTRLQDAGARVLFTADGGFRRGKLVEIKKEADKAVEGTSVERVVVLKRAGNKVELGAKDTWFDSFVNDASDEFTAIPVESEDYSMILYTSGTTGKPKGAVHSHAGALVQCAKEITYNFDCKPDDVFFWLTDLGWMMGPWMMIGANFNAATCVLFEGAPDWPQPDRVWEIVDKHKITILGISPTAIRALKKHGDEWVEKHSFKTLRLLGSTGEPWDEQSWSWFFDKVGKGRLPIINISGGTEIVGCFLIPSPLTSLKPTTLYGPGLGMDIDVFDDNGNSIREHVGYLVCKKPSPSMTRGLWNAPERYLETYWSRWPHVWNHGDWARIDADGFWFLHGRADDTIKIAGKRVGPAEIEAALLTHPAVAEAAAVGVPHEVKGESAVCFVVLKPGFQPAETLREELKRTVAEELGKPLMPETVKFVSMLPKTRSAKIMRRVIKKKYAGEDVGDISTLENPEAVDEITRAR